MARTENTFEKDAFFMLRKLQFIVLIHEYIATLNLVIHEYILRVFAQQKYKLKCVLAL